MSAADVTCDHYLQHTWRKDTCANCLKPRKQHSPTANPQPAKRLSKTSNPTSREASVILDKDEPQKIDEGQPETQMESSPLRARLASGPDAKQRLSVVGSPKPAPIKAKPSIVSKPEKARKPGVIVDGGEKTGTTKKVAKEPIPQDASSASDIALETTAASKQDLRTAVIDIHNETSDVDLDREPAHAVQKTTKARPRPQITPPQVPDPSKIPNSPLPMTRSDAKTPVKAKPSEALDPRGTKSSGSHYYQIYDISAKGLSGTPEPIDAPEQNGVTEAGKRGDAKGTRASVCRVVEEADEPQNVAMPYTVVDVTLCQPNKDQLASKAPPQLPLTPAPIRESGATSVSLSNTLPTNRPWSTTTRDASDVLRHATLNSTPNSTHDPLRSGLVNPSTTDSGETPSARGVAVLPLDGKFLVGKMANQDLYEDIASNNNGEMPAAGVKSAALEAKMAALSKLDLSRPVGSSSSSLTAIHATRSDDARPDILAAAAGDRQDTDEMRSGGEIVTAVSLSRQEKGRKSGGKSFFQKFLKRGNKETTVEATTAQGRTSSLNISIEPIINTTPPALGQSSLELVAPSSSDSLVSSSSPSKMSSNKHPLFPIASPAKKSLQTNDALEAGDLSSANSSICSSEESGRTPEKATLEQLMEKPLADRLEETISGHLLPTSVRPPADGTQSPKSIVLNDDASKTDVSLIKPNRNSLTAARDKLKPNSRIPDGFKLADDKMAFAESLRDALALKMSEKDAAAGGGGGKDAVIDLSPTTDGTDEAINSLNSTKSIVQKDLLKSSKSNRKMIAPPPMAPPPPPPPSSFSRDQDGNSSSPKHSATMAAETDQQRSLSPSFHGSLTLAGRQMKPADETRMRNAGSLSNTLPRKSSSSSPSNSTGLKVAAGAVGLRQLDSAAKHARNKTVSEGVRFEKLMIAPDEGEENKKKRPEDTMAASETLDRRASKFLNRALPPPPQNESPPPPDHDNCLDEIDNLYELVSQSDSTAEKNSVDNEQLTYEDIDLYCAKTNNGNGSKTSSTSSSQRSNGIQAAATSQKQRTSSSDPLASPSSSYYLEPVGGKEESDGRGRGVKDDWRPCPAPRGSHPPSSKGMVVGEEQTSTMPPYVNTRMINGQLPLNTSDGFDAMAGLIVNMLYHLTDRLYTTYVTRFLRNRPDVFWTDFELLDFTPRIVQEMATFYQAKHLVLAPSGCILMVARESQASSFSLEPMHANVISPLLCFAMTASDLETINSSTTDETSTTLRNATAAILLCSDVATIDSFWAREHDKVLDESTTIVFEQTVCLCMVEILNALLYLRDSGCTVLRLSSDDVIMARMSDSKWHPLVKPSVLTFDLCSDHDSAFLGEDLIQLLFLMLRMESGKNDKQEMKAIVPRTRYSRGLQRVLRLMVAPRTWEGLDMGRNLLEFILWGPSEEEAKFVAMTDKRDTSFRVWLEVARCRMASELVLDLERHNLELANQAKFLCRVTENSLLGVTKLLFE